MSAQAMRLLRKKRKAAENAEDEEEEEDNDNDNEEDEQQTSEEDEEDEQPTLIRRQTLRSAKCKPDTNDKPSDNEPDDEPDEEEGDTEEQAPPPPSHPRVYVLIPRYRSRPEPARHPTPPPALDEQPSQPIIEVLHASTEGETSTERREKVEGWRKKLTTAGSLSAIHDAPSEEDEDQLDEDAEGPRVPLFFSSLSPSPAPDPGPQQAASSGPPVASATHGELPLVGS
ncbi:hypothetical protein C8F01DRAFT_1111906 [Mycena amicta]|nr:hypothetical protein C8F01DRAFT_1111906 [Mycena amicta]